jgi:hypothetical protein
MTHILYSRFLQTCRLRGFTFTFTVRIIVQFLYQDEFLYRIIVQFLYQDGTFIVRIIVQFLYQES